MKNSNDSKNHRTSSANTHCVANKRKLRITSKYGPYSPLKCVEFKYQTINHLSVLPFWSTVRLPEMYALQMLHIHDII